MLWLISSSRLSGAPFSTTWIWLALAAATPWVEPPSGNPSVPSSRAGRSGSLRRKNGRRAPSAPIEPIIWSRRFFSAAGRSITGSSYCTWLVALTLTATIRSQRLETTGTIGIGLSRPPSTSTREPCTTGVNRLGMAAEARMA
ncbi:hypothetical protein D9M71_486860 [compost metagenome]